LELGVKSTVPNVIALIKDDRVRRQVEQYLAELDIDDLRFATFASQQEFQDIYFRDRVEVAGDVPPPADATQADPPSAETAPSENNSSPADSALENEGEDGAELKLFSEVHLVIFALDSIEGKAAPWIEQLRKGLKKYKRYPTSGRIRLVLLKYEDDGVSEQEFNHPLLDDLIYIPLDRLLFLQKIFIYLTLPKRAGPKYLFAQEVQIPIEISKIVKMDRLSDVALAIRNPVPLKKGLTGHFYVMFPGEKTRLELYGKVIRSVAHPEQAGQFLVYFTHFGLSRTGLTSIRKMLSKSSRYQSLKLDNREAFRSVGHDLFAGDNSAQTKQFGVAVLDPDDSTTQALSKQLNKDMDRLNVLTENSFSVFQHKFLMGSGTPTTRDLPKPVDPSEVYSIPVTLTASRELKTSQVIPPASPEATFLGHPTEGLSGHPDKWLALVKDKESRLRLDESVQLALQGRTLNMILTVQDAQDTGRALSFRIKKDESADNLVTIEITPTPMNEIVDHLVSQVKPMAFDIWILDSGFMPHEPSEWMENIRTRAVQVGLCQRPQDLKFIILTDREQIPPGVLNQPDILGSFCKPPELRQLTFLLSEALGNTNTLYHFDNLGWAEPNLPIHVSKEVALLSISEYGATISSSQRMAPGTLIYLRKSIYENAPNNCLAARVYMCEEDPSNSDRFLVYATYFGISDGFLKFARTWIRENYAHQKEQQQG